MKTLLPAFAVLLLSLSNLSADKLPNIMVFLIDDMGVMDTSVPFLTDENGKPGWYPLNDYYRTPGMERLAKQGIRFNQFYAMSVCSPTRISIMTATNAARHRATNWINPRGNNRGATGPDSWNWPGLKKGDVTLPGVPRTRAAKTIHVGKAHFGPNDQEGSEPLNLGFDINVGGLLWRPGSYYAEKKYGKGTRRGHHAVPHLDKYADSDTFLSEALTIEAKKHITKIVQSDQPFFLHFSHYAVHSPFESDPRFAAHYSDSGKPKSARAFATLIAGMDKSLEYMLDHFEKLGVAEDTLVIFLGDNGSDAPLGHQHDVACSAPLRGKKGAHYEGRHARALHRGLGQAQCEEPPSTTTEHSANRLPAAGCQCHRPVPHPAPVGCVPRHPRATRSTANHCSCRSPAAAISSLARSFHAHYPHGPHRSNYFTVWRDGDWKVIYHNFPKAPPLGGKVQSGGEHYELFNLVKDPFESVNVAKDHPGVLGK